MIVAVRGDGPAACAVNVRDAGFPACVIVRKFIASASVAVAVIVAIGLPSAPFAVEGAVIAGVWFVLAVTVKFCDALCAFAVAVTEAGNVPVVPSGGARWMFPVRVFPTCALSVLVMKLGPEDVNAIASPSGSVALMP